jgi:TetR/AcrR family transcriptional repressor of mexJK operon
MEEIAAAAGLTKRTLYNNYGGKDALFTHIVADVMAYADVFVLELREAFSVGINAANLGSALDDLGRRLALSILRPEVIALRRLLIGEARTFPDLAAEYLDRVPARVIETLASRLEYLDRLGLLHVADAHRAAAQFAYLVAGEPLDRAMLTGTMPPGEEIIACAREGVGTFLARFGLRPAI